MLDENPHFGVFVLDRRSRVLYVNSRIEDLTGYSPEEFYETERMAFRIVHPDDHAVGIRAFRRALLGRPSQHQEFRLLHRDGTTRWTSSACFPVLDSDGRVVRVQVVLQDISGRRQAEQELEWERRIRDGESAVRLQIASMNAETDLIDVVVEISTQMRALAVAHAGCSIQIVNESGTDFFSCGPHLDVPATAQRLNTGLAWERVSDNVDHYPWVIQVWRSGEPHRIASTHDRGLLPPGFSVLDVAYSHGTLALSRPQQPFTEHEVALLQRFAIVLSEGFQRFIDITDRGRLQQQLLQAQKMEAVGQLVAGVSHNFNNLLMEMQGSIELALRADGDGERKHLADAMNASERAAELIRELMVFSRPSPASDTALDIAQVVRESVDICSRAIDPRIALHLNVASELPPVQGRASHLQQVVMNLCLNARDALASVEDPRIDVELTLEPTSNGGTVRLQVRDNGVGMDADTSRRVFEPFFTTKDVGEGTGLGLATVFAIVQGHGGTIDVASQTGIGTAFTVRLPATDVKPALVEEPAQTAPQTGATILLIDDEEGVRQVIGQLLTRGGHRVESMDDGAQALDWMEHHGAAVDLVILDLSMPNLSGQQVLTRLRRLRPDVPVIILSGLDVADDIDGATAIIQKPVRQPTLLEQVALAINQRDMKET